MNNSVAVTGGISASTATLVTLIQWLFPTIPAAVLPALAGVVVAGLHAAHQLAVLKGWYPTDESSPKAQAAPDAAKP